LSRLVPWYYDYQEARIINRPEGRGWSEADEIRMGLVGMSFFSLRDIEEGEELSYDYKLSPNSLKPDWYRASE